MVTIFENIYADQPYYVTVEKALDRIKTGASRLQVDVIRNTWDKEKVASMKKNLPSVLWAGKFTSRKDESITEHSGLCVLDFDDVDDIPAKLEQLQRHPSTFACWVSPTGYGVKALVRIADGKKHRQHFEAIAQVYPEVDRSGINISRVCFESYDPNIYINLSAKPFTEIAERRQISMITENVKDESEIFKSLLKWLQNRNSAFVTGERNLYIFKLASACCRFGLDQLSAENLISREYVSSSDFTEREMLTTIRSAYRANKGQAGTVRFEKEVLVDTLTKSEVEIDASLFESVRPKDVIYGCDVKQDAVNLYKFGYQLVDGIGVLELDQFFKMKKGEITLLTGIGNYGKSSFKKWFLLMRAIKFDEKFAVFSPEELPAHEYYHDLVEILLGSDCTSRNPNRPAFEQYTNAYDWVQSHFFFVYPKELAPTPEYIKEIFLQLIIKEKVSGVVVDPFNQLSNDYKSAGGRSDKYLETFLSDFSRFNQKNETYGLIVAHPKQMQKDSTGNYPCPDVFDVADGAMWNNKMDNILVYHRPFAQSDPDNPFCEFHSKKIKRQKIVGKKGFIGFELIRSQRRFFFSGKDYMEILLKERGLTFKKEQQYLYEAV